MHCFHPKKRTQIALETRVHASTSIYDMKCSENKSVFVEPEISNDDDQTYGDELVNGPTIKRHRKWRAIVRLYCESGLTISAFVLRMPSVFKSKHPDSDPTKLRTWIGDYKREHILKGMFWKWSPSKKSSSVDFDIKSHMISYLWDYIEEYRDNRINAAKSQITLKTIRESAYSACQCLGLSFQACHDWIESKDQDWYIRILRSAGIPCPVIAVDRQFRMFESLVKQETYYKCIRNDDALELATSPRNLFPMTDDHVDYFSRPVILSFDDVVHTTTTVRNKYTTVVNDYTRICCLPDTTTNSKKERAIPLSIHDIMSKSIPMVPPNCCSIPQHVPTLNRYNEVISRIIIINSHIFCL